MTRLRQRTLGTAERGVVREGALAAIAFFRAFGEKGVLVAEFISPKKYTLSVL